MEFVNFLCYVCIDCIVEGDDVIECGDWIGVNCYVVSFE